MGHDTGDSLFRPRWVSLLRILFVVTACCGLVAYVWISRRWPLIHDMQVMHYVSFLIDRGWAPYREIGDMNMPGAYLMEGLALKVFGTSDFGWRLYDFALSGLLIASCIAIARKYDWLAGFAAGWAFAILHGGEGPRLAGQRDQVMAVLLVIGCALTFEAVRQKRAWLLSIATFVMFFAGAIKPTVLLFPLCAILLALYELSKHRMQLAPYILSVALGVVGAGGLVLAFLLKHGSVNAFLFDVFRVLPHYTTVGNVSWRYMLSVTIPPLVLVIELAAVAAAVLGHSRQNWEKRTLLLGAACGLFSFFSQHKGFFQHRYTWLAFVLIWAFIELGIALQGTKLTQAIAAAAVCFCVLVFLPRYVNWMRTYPTVDYPSQYLEGDLEAMGVGRLQGEIQCLDMVDGCLNALFTERIVQQTGATGDFLYFLREPSPIVDRARADYWSVLKGQPPDVYVLFNWEFGKGRSFRRIEAWPQFAWLLSSDYQIVEQREFPEGRLPTSTPGSDPKTVAYRIYIRRGSDLAATKFPN